MTGILASTIVNWSMGAPKEPRYPKDTPGLSLLQEDDVVKPRRRINRARVSKQIRAAFDGAMKRQKANAPQPPRDVSA